MPKALGWTSPNHTLTHSQFTTQRTLASLTENDLAGTSAAISGNCVQLVNRAGAWIYRARYEKDVVYYETPDHLILAINPSAVSEPGVISVRGLPSFTLAATPSGVTATLPDRTIITSDYTTLKVISPHCETYTRPIPRIPVLGGHYQTLISAACARDLAGMGLAAIGLIAGCALTGGALAIAIVNIAGFASLGISEWSTASDCRN